MRPWVWMLRCLQVWTLSAAALQTASCAGQTDIHTKSATAHAEKHGSATLGAKDLQRAGLASVGSGSAQARLPRDPPCAQTPGFTRQWMRQVVAGATSDVPGNACKQGLKTAKENPSQPGCSVASFLLACASAPGSGWDSAELGRHAASGGGIAGAARGLLI